MKVTLRHTLHAASGGVKLMRVITPLDGSVGVKYGRKLFYNIALHLRTQVTAVKGFITSSTGRASVTWISIVRADVTAPRLKTRHSKLMVFVFLLRSCQRVSDGAKLHQVASKSGFHSTRKSISNRCRGSSLEQLFWSGLAWKSSNQENSFRGLIL